LPQIEEEMSSDLDGDGLEGDLEEEGEDDDEL
jgi:hypothetical protein